MTRRAFVKAAGAGLELGGTFAARAKAEGVPAGFDCDTAHSQLVYAAGKVIAVFDMATRGEQRIAGASSGNRPYAISADHRLLVWSIRNQCGDKLMTRQDESELEHFCLACLSKSERRQ